ncbi:hemagglutinin [Ornithobacterium rhinotracheale]|uniref:Hemagglutinin n=1 Tax=Ornithobacterium rhinotracheale TaxID=28251 RepID=A0A3R5XUN6_ORNRH|nr:DUF6261 family protein [Ornithobacterium rhinotracheale]QAR30933.1 hemagglutinin [Ornithobacterium rhinotracheale]
MILEKSLQRVRMMEFFQLMSDLKTFLDKENAESLKIQAVKTNFEQKLVALDQALKPLAKSSFTQEIQELDEQRDHYLSGLILHCKAYSLSPTPAQREHAQKLMLEIEKYGKRIQHKPLQEESGIIVNLLGDLATPAIDTALKGIGASFWVDAIKTTNNALVQRYNQRTEERGAISLGKAKQARQQMTEAFTQLVKTLNALALIHGEEAYQNLANNFNERIKKALL